MTGRGRIVGAVVAALVLSGCVNVTAAAPMCVGGEDSMVLMAQSVPSATLVPCIDALPASWQVMQTEIKSGASRLVFHSDAAMEGFSVEMLFEAACDVGEAVRIPSDEENVARYEWVDSIDTGYRGRRYYVFDGGCVTYRFDLRGDGWSAAVNDASGATSFTTRAAVTDYVRRRSRGVIDTL